MTDDLWLKTSIMARRGLAKAHAGKRHELTIEGQGSFRHVGDCCAVEECTMGASILEKYLAS